VNLGEFQMKLLEKIEELTLYTVQQAQVTERQKEGAAAEASALRERIKTLEDMVRTLVERIRAGGKPRN